MIRSIRLGTLLVPAALGCAILLLSVWLGPDASWDLRNYHLYDAFSALRKHGFTDLVAAQRQTFHPPMVDLPSLWLRFRLNHWPHLLDAILAVPSAVAVVIAWFIGRRIEPDETFSARLSLVLAVLFGATGVAGLPTTGTSMSEMPAACFALAGLALLLTDPGSQASGWRAMLAGLGFGVAFALKPTLAILGIAAAVAIALCTPVSASRRLIRLFWFSLGVALGALVIGGPWWWHLTRLTGSPLFPYMNQLFQSPLVAPVDLPNWFVPRSELQALFYPLFWAVSPSRLVSELTVRDPRLAIAFVATICCGLIAFLRSARPVGDRKAGFLLVFLAIAFILWEAGFSILRYLAPIELLSGIAILIALQPLKARSPMLPPAILAVLLLGSAAITIYPDWGRASPATTAASVEPPPLPPDAMVLLLTGDPMAYVAAYMAPTIRFVGVDNNLVHPGQDSALERQIEQAVRTHQGPLFGLQPSTPGDPGAAVLRFYGLHRDGPCQPVRSNLDGNALAVCRLRR